MPLIVAQLVRVLVQAATQTGLILVVGKIIEPLTDLAKKTVAKVFDLTEEEAEDTIANEIIDALALVGIIGASIRTKIPTKVAEKLGFTNKGYGKRKVSTKVTKAKVTKETAEGLLQKAKKFGAFFEKRLNTVFLGFLVASGLIDFGNWETGAYSDTFQKIFEKVTFGLLKPNEDFRKTRTASPEVFNKVYNAYQLEGAISINDPYKEAVVPFTRDNLIDLVDKVGAHLLTTSGQATTKQVIEATQILINFSSKPAVVGAGASTTQGSAVVGPSQVFSLVGQAGVAGGALSFKPRQDDLIESMEELKTALANNTAPWLASLPTWIRFEVKEKSRIVVDGVSLVGGARKLQTGTNADGTAKYKNYVNKFAVCEMYFVKDADTRIKLAEIVLGPTDAVKFRPTVQELVALSDNAPKEIVITKTDDVKAVVSNTPTESIVAYTPPETETKIDWPQRPAPAPGEVYIYTNPTTRTRSERAKETFDSYFKSNNQEYESTMFAILSQLSADPTVVNSTTIKWAMDAKKAWDEFKAKGEEPKKEEKRISPIEGRELSEAEYNAETLEDFYRAGNNLPLSKKDQAEIYEMYGLGRAEFYTGNAEQSLKLLRKYQGKS